MKFKPGNKITRVSIDNDRYHAQWKASLKERGMVDGNVYTFVRYMDGYDKKLEVYEFPGEWFDTKRFVMVKENSVLQILKEVDKLQ